jgi:hypothetical protein
MKHVVLFLMALFPLTGFATTSLFAYKLGEKISNENKELQEEQSQNESGEKYNIYKSEYYRDPNNIIFNYTIKTNHQNSSIYFIQYDLIFPENYDVLQAFSQLSQWFGPVTSGPMQTIRLREKPGDQKITVIPSYSYALTWGCNLIVSFSPWAAMTWSQKDNEPCIEAVVKPSLNYQELRFQASITLQDFKYRK